MVGGEGGGIVKGLVLKQIAVGGRHQGGEGQLQERSLPTDEQALGGIDLLLRRREEGTVERLEDRLVGIAGGVRLAESLEDLPDTAGKVFALTGEGVGVEGGGSEGEKGGLLFVREVAE